MRFLWSLLLKREVWLAFPKNIKKKLQILIKITGWFKSNYNYKTRKPKKSIKSKKKILYHTKNIDNSKYYY